MDFLELLVCFSAQIALAKKSRINFNNFSRLTSSSRFFLPDYMLSRDCGVVRLMCNIIRELNLCIEFIKLDACWKLKAGINISKRKLCRTNLYTIYERVPHPFQHFFLWSDFKHEGNDILILRCCYLWIYKPYVFKIMIVTDERIS